jgi:hypothetical protein
LTSEDALAAAVAAEFNVMKRLFSLITVILILISVFGCAPDNIISPDSQPDSAPVGTQTQQPTPEPQPEPVPEPQPAPAVKDKKNTEVKPTFDIDTLDYVKVKTAELKEKELSMFVGSSSFSAGSLTETDWLCALAESYGIKIKYSVTPDRALYSSQLIAQKSGKTVDIISAKVRDCMAALSLMQDSSELVTKTDKDPFSAKVFDLTGGKLFAGKGNAKAMWFNTAIVKDAPADNWTFEDFKKLATDIRAADLGVIENESIVEFMSSGKEQLTGFNSKEGYIMRPLDETAKLIIEDYAKATLLPEESAADKKFYRENVAFVYTDAPVRRNMTISWAPMPAYSEDGTNIMALCGSGLGLSKTVSEQNRDTALTFIMLWCARYTESREDALVFDLGISKASCDRYIDLSEQSGIICAADREINAIFATTGFPEAYYKETEEETAPDFEKALSRAKLISERY